MNLTKKSGDILGQEIKQTTKLEIVSFNEKQIKYLMVRNELIGRKESNKIYRIGIKQQNKEMVINKVINYFGRFKVKRFMIILDNGNKSQIQFHLIKKLHFEEIMIIENRRKIDLQTNQMKQLKVEEDKERGFLKEKQQFSVINVIDSIINSKISYQIMSIVVSGRLDQILLIRDTFLKQPNQSCQSQTLNQQQQSYKQKPIKQLKQETKNHLISTCNQRKQHNYTINLNQKCQNLKYNVLSFIQKFLVNDLSKPQDSKQKLSDIKQSNSKSMKPSIFKLNQSVSLNLNEQRILYLKVSQQFGIQIHIIQQIFSFEQLRSILISLCQCKSFVTLHLQYMPSSLLQTVNMIFNVLQYHKKLLIKILNHLQITHNAITINSKNLPLLIVHHLLKQVQQNHNIYSFVFYGSDSILSEVIQLFTKRPFIQFNFFMPIAQLTPQNHLLFKKMQNISHHLKIKTLQFQAILKNHTSSQINLIKDVFMALHMEDQD